MSRINVDFDSFEVIENRIKSEIGVTKSKDIAKIIECSQPTYSRRKNENNFNFKWAFLISKKYNLLTEWILTGKGPKRINKEITENYFSELETWAKETGKSENIEWLKNQIDQTFPMFKEWRKRKEEEESKDSENSISKIA